MVAAAGVVLAHLLVAWAVFMVRIHPAGEEAVAEPVIAMRIDLPPDPPQEPRPRVEDILRLQQSSPRIEGIQIEMPEVVVPEILVQSDIPVPAPSAPVVGVAAAGTGGDARRSGGQSGAGQLTLLKRVIPAYPAGAARRGEQGVTTLLIHVLENGRVADAKVGRSSGSEQLDKAAVEAARRWRFARLPAGSAPDGKWASTDLGFILYRLTFSRLEDGAAESVYGEQTKSGVADEATPGSEQAFIRFITAVGSGSFTSPESGTRTEIAQLGTALGEWGAVKSVAFTGLAGDGRWMRHGVRQESPGRLRPTVEVSWNMFEVRHQNATSQWMVAVDRDGQVWAARAGKAPDGR